MTVTSQACTGEKTMAKLQIAREVVTRARERSNLTNEEIDKIDIIMAAL